MTNFLNKYSDDNNDNGDDNDDDNDDDNGDDNDDIWLPNAIILWLWWWSHRLGIAEPIS